MSDVVKFLALIVMMIIGMGIAGVVMFALANWTDRRLKDRSRP